MSPSDRVLVLGSGTSTLPVELRNLGFRPLPLSNPLVLWLSVRASRDVLAVDNSPAAVAHMEERHGGSPELKFEVMSGFSGVWVGSVAMTARPSLLFRTLARTLRREKYHSVYCYLLL